MRIRTKIAGMATALVVLTAASIVAIALYQKDVVRRYVREEIDQLVRSEAKKVAQDVYLLCRTMQEAMEKTVAANLQVAGEILARSGGLSFGEERVRWRAVNQFTGEVREVALPRVRIGAVPLDPNRDMARPAPVVDAVTALVGGTCTLFQRMDEEGNMLRVATNVPQRDGSRAIGTFIPRRNPDGAPNPVLEAVLRGKPFTGRAYVVNAWYITAYRPLWDGAGRRVIGVLYVGIREDALGSLRRGIMDITVGKTGYVFVLGGSGEQRGRYIISHHGERDGEDLWETRDENGRPFVQSIVAKALALPPAGAPADPIPVAFERYPWRNPGEPASRTKVVAVTYFAPWDWVIGAGYYEDEFAVSQQRMAGALKGMMVSVLVIAAAIVLVSIFLSLAVAQGISRPLDQAVRTFGELGKGQLDLRLNMAGDDEIVQLSRAFDRMVEDLRKVTASRDELDREIRERARAEEEIRKLAYYDTLTGLPNRALFQDRLRQALFRAEREGRTAALLFLDLDRFKLVNDTLGHASGDALLQAAARRLEEVVRRSDTLARLGGDEFVILLTAAPGEREATVVARKILERLVAPFDLDGQEAYSTASIGIVFYPDDGEDAETLLKHADMAMYAAKEQGRNTFRFFSAALNRQAVERREMETRLRRALQREGELFLVYQPQFDLHTGEMIGVEALVRWQHPELGAIPPDRFIPLAEETGLIRPLGEWVLRSACAQALRWQEEGHPPLRMAVNLSAVQLRHPDLLRVVDGALAEAGLPPHCLELELTEGMLMEDAAAAAALLAELKGRGIGLAIDDFGTGYSSLAYLKHLPIDRIKIDRSFVREVPDDADGATIVETIIAMARNLKLRVLAEGVENAEQVRFLLARGCAEMQGFHFARPVPAEEIPVFLGGGKGEGGGSDPAPARV